MTRSRSGPMPSPEWRAIIEFGEILRAASAPISSTTARGLRDRRAAVSSGADAASRRARRSWRPGRRSPSMAQASSTFPALAAASRDRRLRRRRQRRSRTRIWCRAPGRACRPASSRRWRSPRPRCSLDGSRGADSPDALDAAPARARRMDLQHRHRGPGASAAGLLAGLTPLAASTATPHADALGEDFGALLGAVAPVAGNAPGRLRRRGPRRPRRSDCGWPHQGPTTPCS